MHNSSTLVLPTNMADRFPSIEDFAEGIVIDFKSFQILTLTSVLGQTEPQGNGIGIDGLDSGDDFLSRERAALGDDANQFAGPGDSSNLSANFMDGDDDLLGGGNSYSGGQAGGEEVTEFESSFPAIDTRNEVGSIL